MRDPQRLARLLSLSALVFSVGAFAIYFIVGVMMQAYDDRQALNGRVQPEYYAILLAVGQSDAANEGHQLPKL